MSQNGNILAFQDIGFESNPERNVIRISGPIRIFCHQVPIFFCKKIEGLQTADRFRLYCFIISSHFGYDITIRKSVCGYGHKHRGPVKPSGQPVIIKIHPAIVPGVVFVLFLVGRAINILPCHTDPVTVAGGCKGKPERFRHNAARICHRKGRSCFHLKSILAVPCLQCPEQFETAGYRLSGLDLEFVRELVGIRHRIPGVIPLGIPLVCRQLVRFHGTGALYSAYSRYGK